MRPQLASTTDDDLHETLLSPVESVDLDTPTSDAFGFFDESPSRSYLHTSFFALSEGTSYSPLIRKCRKVIFGLVIAVIWPWGLYSYHQLPAHLTSQGKAIPDTPSFWAKQAFATYNQSSQDDAMVFVFESRPTNNASTAKDDEGARILPSFSILQYETELKAFDSALEAWRKESLAQNTSSYWRYTSYWTLQAQGLGWMAQSLLNHNQNLLVAQLEYDTNKDDLIMSAVQRLVDGFDAPHVSLRMTSLRLLQDDLRASTRRDLRLEDLVVLPLALLLMGIALPQANPLFLWIVPLTTLLTTVATWSIGLHFLALQTSITTTTPTIMMSLSLGMGIDYTLFLLARYLIDRSIDDMLQQTSRVLLLSGLTLMTTFLCFLSMPLLVLRSMGLGASLAIASALVVNLTLVPCLLSTSLGSKIYSDRRATSSSSSSLGGPSKSVWFRLAKWLLEPHRAIIALLLVLHVLVPVAQYATHLKTSLRLDLAVPRTSPALQVYRALGDNFGSGQMHPYRVLFDGRAANISVTSIYAFDIQHMVIDELIAIDHEESMGLTHLGDLDQQDWYHANSHWLDESSCVDDLIQAIKPTATVYSGISVLHNARVPYAVYYASKLCGGYKPYCPVELLNIVHAMDVETTTSDESMTYVTATLGVSPFEEAGVQWLASARETVGRMKDAGVLGGIDVHILGTAGIEYDAMEAVQQAFPIMALVTVGVVVLLLGLFFQSVLAPIRSIASILMTLSFSYGLSVLVFQKGLLAWTGLDALTPSTDGADSFCWLVPVMSFSIIVGLALDYDVFLMSSILELRESGFELRSSVAAGLTSSGGIITAAGLIMSFAFGSLMLSSNPLLYQWAFIITAAVLFDTFVVRPIVAPSLISLSGCYAWWPRSLPMESVCFQDFQSDSHGRIGILDTLEDEQTSEYEPLAMHRRADSRV